MGALATKRKDCQPDGLLTEMQTSLMYLGVTLIIEALPFMRILSSVLHLSEASAASLTCSSKHEEFWQVSEDSGDTVMGGLWLIF